MPSSNATGIEYVCHWLTNRKEGEIKSVLDVGPGFGKWGFLCRLHLQVYKKLQTLKQYMDVRKTLLVDAIEIYPQSITDLQYQIYNNIIQGDMRDILPAVEKYDLIIFGDVLEHVSLEDGLKCLEIARQKAKYVLIIMPTRFFPGEANIGNDAEKHKHVWDKKDFPDSPQHVLIHNTQVALYIRKSA